MADTGLRVEGLCFSYAQHNVLNGISLAIVEGSMVGLLGANGAGKTTLFDVICGLRKQTDGSVFILDNKCGIAYLPQAITLPDALKLEEVVDLVLEVSGANKHQLDSLLAEEPERVRSRFKQLLARRGNNCSYGEKRWLIVMLMLAMDASVYMLDEPTAGVDLEFRYFMFTTLKRLAAKRKSVLFATHIVQEIEQYADYFYLLHDGKARRFESAGEFIALAKASTMEEAFVRHISGGSFAAI